MTYDLPISYVRALVISWFYFKSRGITGGSWILYHKDVRQIPANRRVIVTIRVEDIEAKEPGHNPT